MADLNDNDFILISPPSGFANCGIKKGQIIPPQSGESLYAHKFLNLLDVSILFPLMGGWISPYSNPSLTDQNKVLNASKLKNFLGDVSLNVRSLDDGYYINTQLFEKPLSGTLIVDNTEPYRGGDKHQQKYANHHIKTSYIPIPAIDITSDGNLSASIFSMASGTSSPFYCMYHEANRIKSSALFPSYSDLGPSGEDMTWSSSWGSHGTGKKQVLATYYSYSGTVEYSEKESHPVSIPSFSADMMYNIKCTSGQKTTKSLDILDFGIVVYADVKTELYDRTKQRKIAYVKYDDPTEIGSITSDSYYIYFSTSGTSLIDAYNAATSLTQLSISYPPSSGMTIGDSRSNTMEVDCGFFPLVTLKPEIASLLNQP